MTTAPTALETESRSELRQLVRTQLKLLLEQNNFEGAKGLLIPVQSVDIAEAIEGLPEAMQVIAFRLLGQQEAIEVYEYLESSVQQALIEQFVDQEVIDIVGEMSPDDRVKLFDDLPPKLVRRLLLQLSPEEREATAQLLGYPVGTAGRLMTSKLITIQAHLTPAQAQAELRNAAQDAELTYYIYVTDHENHLIGIISLRDLVLATPEQTIAEFMTQDVVYALTDTDQEEVASLIQRYDLIALPIVDHEKNLLGVITVDDVLDILEEEVKEDIYAMGALPADKDNYFQKSFFAVTKQRIPWLMVLLITNTITVFILSQYEEVLDQVVALAFFTPLLIDAGGNVGAQSSTVVIRGLSTEELKDQKPPLVILRELMTGGLLGILLGVVVIVAIFAFLGNGFIGVTVGFSLFCIAAIAATTGAALPFLFNALGFDPALMSAPFITTVVDILGVLIYLNVAQRLLGL